MHIWNNCTIFGLAAVTVQAMQSGPNILPRSGDNLCQQLIAQFYRFLDALAYAQTAAEDYLTDGDDRNHLGPQTVYEHSRCLSNRAFQIDSALASHIGRAGQKNGIAACFQGKGIS